MNQNKINLLTYLKSQDLLSIATADKEPHIAIVYYGIDDNFTFYIVTPPTTKHGQHIAHNPSVACAVVDTTQGQFKTEKKIGAQIAGEAIEITDDIEMEKALLIWSKGKTDVANKYFKNIKANSVESRPYLIQPKEIKWFNEELFGEEGTEIFQY